MQFFKISLLILITLLFDSVDRRPLKSDDHTKMNILFISVDDLRTEINCYGQSQMKTPHMDLLAREGFLFNRTYVQQAICMASRASILTGIRPENRKLYNCKSLEELVPDIKTLNEHFEQNGYLVEAIGKVYHHKADHLAQFGERWHDPRDQWEGRGYVSDEAIAEIAANTRFNSGKSSRGPAYEMADVADNQYIDGANTDYAISKLKMLSNQNAPFFMAMGFHKPHLPWCAPKKYWDMYPVDEIDLSEAPELPHNLTPYSLTNWGELRNYFGIPQGKEKISDELAIQLRRAYFACVSYVDAQLGRLLEALEQNGLEDNTIVVLWGDHGFKLGDHQAWSKHTTFEVDTKVPLIIRTPGQNNPGRHINSLTELVDLYPTLCDLVDIDPPAHLEGQSLKSLMELESNEKREAAYSIFPRNRTEDSKTITGFSMRTDQFRYTEWIHLASGRILAKELYDHHQDPLENENRIDLDLYSDHLESLSSKLHQKYDRAIPGLKEHPNVFLYDPAALVYARSLYRQKTEPYVSLVKSLQQNANELLDVPPFSVMQKKHMPPSNDKHDYYSIGIYWWPNPETTDGLPYVRHDGKKNPEYDQFDGPAIHKMANAAHTLSLAYFYTSDETYAKKATELIHTWFIDPESRMNPHLEFGQAIPGITEGRGIGIIETGNLLKVIHAVGLLEGSSSFTKVYYEYIRRWIQDYNHWLSTSQKGWDERRWHNNHGSSYDSQVICFAIFGGQDSLARVILDSVTIKRIDRQIFPDGSQPWELERTKSMSYSIKNLDHLIENAILGMHFGVDLWSYESKDGRSINKAIKFLIPYMLGEKEWPYEQYGGIQGQMIHFKEMIWIANQYLEDKLIKSAVEELCFNVEDPLSITLLYPPLDSKVELDPR